MAAQTHKNASWYTYDNMADERRNWTREETIVAFNLYCKIPFGKITKSNPIVIEHAMALGRTPSALTMKIGNLARLDPELKKRGVSGLANGSKMDEEVWNDFNNDWNNLVFESEKIIASLRGVNVESTINTASTDDLVLPAGTDKEVTAKARVFQSFFRSALLVAYGGKCCITGLPIPQLLIASHIIPWTESVELRTDPRNGLLLNSIHDDAFDKGLITVTLDYKVKVSSRIHSLLPDKIVTDWFINYDGKSINLPERFLPSTASLTWHHENVFIT